MQNQFAFVCKTSLPSCRAGRRDPRGRGLQGDRKSTDDALCKATSANRTGRFADKENDMKHLLGAGVSLAVLCLTGGAALAADCGISSGKVAILSNDFEALRVLADAAKECANDKV